MRMTILAAAAIIGAASAAANAQTPAGAAVSACPAGYGWVGPYEGKWNVWHNGHCVKYTTTAVNAVPTNAACPAGSGWVDAHFDRWSNWVGGACVQYRKP